MMFSNFCRLRQSVDNLLIIMKVLVAFCSMNSRCFVFYALTMEQVPPALQEYFFLTVGTMLHVTSVILINSQFMFMKKDGIVTIFCLEDASPCPACCLCNLYSFIKVLTCFEASEPLFYS